MYSFYSQRNTAKERPLSRQVVRCGKLFWSTLFDMTKKTAAMSLFSIGVLTFPVWWFFVCWYNKRQSDKLSTCSGENKDDGQTEGRETRT